MSFAQAQTPSAPCVLVIGGLDPSGGAGLTADARAIKAFGAHALPVLSCVVAQNTQGVQAFQAVAPEMLAAQLDALLRDVRPQGVKVGLLPDEESVSVVAQRLRTLREVAPQLPIVFDPVLAPSSGPQFVSDDAAQELATQLFPLCELVTPNALEAARFTGLPLAKSLDEARKQCAFMSQKFEARAVLFKGGHLLSNDADLRAHSIDVLFDGATHELRAPRVQGYDVRGTGCLLASTIAAQRAQNVALLEAVRNAKTWLWREIGNAKTIGHGRRVAV